MKKHLIFLSAAAFCLSGAQQTVSAQLTLENSYETLKASLPGMNSGKIALPQDRDAVETQPQSIWPQLPATEYYWHVGNEAIQLAQVEEGLAEFQSGFLYLSLAKRGGAIKSLTLEKKKNSPYMIYINSIAADTGLPLKIGIPIAVAANPSNQLKSLKLAYASAQGPENKWLVRVFFELDEYQLYFKTEAEARKFLDIISSCRSLAGLPSLSRSKTGFSVSDLTPAQAEALGKNRLDSALVTAVVFDGPGDLAKIRFLDLITEVDGVKVRNAGHFNSIVEAAAPGTVLKLACLERTIVMEGDQKKFVWTPKTVELPIK